MKIKKINKKTIDFCFTIFIFVTTITKHLICASFELIEQVCVAELCCVEDQGRASHRVVEPGEDLDHGDVEDGDCD